jgi:hypothetical protein
MKLEIGSQQPKEPTVRFWLDQQTSDKIFLVAKHDDDTVSQNVAVIELGSDGIIEIELRKIHSKFLLEALGIDKGNVIGTKDEGF